jgi:hypothetical protein
LALHPASGRWGRTPSIANQQRRIIATSVRFALAITILHIALLPFVYALTAVESPPAQFPHGHRTLVEQRP